MQTQVPASLARIVYELTQATHEEAPVLGALLEGFLDPILTATEDMGHWTENLLDAEHELKSCFPDGMWPEEWRVFEMRNNQALAAIQTIAFVCGMIAANPTAAILGGVDASTLRFLRGPRPGQG